MVSQDDFREPRVADVEQDQLWFRQFTREVNAPDGDDFERMVRDNNSYIGKIFSKTFSEFQPRLSPLP